MVQLLLSCIPLVVIILLMLLLKVKEKRGIHLIVDSLFWGFISIIIVAILGLILQNVFPIIYSLQKFRSFLFYLVFAGILEECSKFAALKLSKPKSHKQTIINAIFIATMFALIEDYTYFGNALSNSSIISRLVTPGHALYLLFPTWFMIAGDKTKCKKLMVVLGLILGIFVHSVYDTIDKDLVTDIIYGVIGYLAIFISLYNASKMPDDDEDATKTNDNENAQPNDEQKAAEAATNQNIKIQKDKFFVPKLITVILLSLFLAFTFNVNNRLTPMNQFVHDVDENVDIKVISAETVEVKSTFGKEPHTEIKIGVTVKNTSTNDYTVTDMNFKLVRITDGEEKITTFFVKDDSLQETLLKPQEEVTGYLYYEANGEPSEYRLKFKKFLSENVGCIFELQ